jgi:hypothetical protein
MRRIWFSPVVVLLLALPLALASDKPAVTFVSPAKCEGDHGVWRWTFKTEDDMPPPAIPEDHSVTPSDLGDWDALPGTFHKDTPRSGREKEWFSLTGRVVLVRAEADGDLHVQLEDTDGEGDVQVVVEVPVNHNSPTAPWSDIRKTVFGWTKTHFPFTTKRGKKLQLKENPVIRVIGKAFYDADHASKDVPNRRKNDLKTAVWEIHPVMQLDVVSTGE